MDSSAKTELAEKLKSANNVLVTVSSNPSVDQLAALLGLTLTLNKLGKHAAAVFSGAVPSTIEFLEPEATIEKNTDSLRDFIIALDKSKADKLRYKVENNVVRIFITPYKTSISQEDLDFSQGDFNVDLVVALGVHEQAELDQAITAHGRILHDATVATITVSSTPSELGAINWSDQHASSLSELVATLCQQVNPTGVDAQIATALLTGIVAETNRFSNDKTSAQTMSISAALMAAGANQQLVATKLEVPAEPVAQPAEPIIGIPPLGMPPPAPAEAPPADGMLEIEHENTDDDEPEPPAPEVPDRELPPVDEQPAAEEPQPDTPPAELSAAHFTNGSRLITEAPTLGGDLTANAVPEALDPSVDPLSMIGASAPAPLLDHDAPAATSTRGITLTPTSPDETTTEPPVVDTPPVGPLMMPPILAPATDPIAVVPAEPAPLSEPAIPLESPMPA
ncbi:MAG: hypothetical protein ACREGB_00100, partial [Candidatus Saccharimonadales bacterium]